MKAIAVFPARREVQLIEREEPQITQPTQVKLRMLDIGVCGTDKEICRFEYGTPPADSEYLVIGHESLGIVAEVGPLVSNLRPGDLVVPMVRRPCTHEECLACRQNRQDFCFTGDFRERGIKEEHGFMEEFIVDDAQYMNLIPLTLREVGVLVEPLTIAEKALAQVWQIQQRLPWGITGSAGLKGQVKHKAIVLGAGPVGLLGTMALLNAGFETYVYSRSPGPNAKANLVESLGARYLSDLEVPVERLVKEVGNIDLVYEAVGASAISFEVMKVLGTNGIFAFTGVPGRKAPIEVDTDLLMRDLVLKNQVVFGTVNAGQDSFRAAIRDLEVFLKRWPEAVRSLITGRYSPERFREVLLGAPGGIKNVITFGA